MGALDAQNPPFRIALVGGRTTVLCTERISYHGNSAELPLALARRKSAQGILDTAILHPQVPEDIPALLHGSAHVVYLQHPAGQTNHPLAPFLRNEFLFRPPRRLARADRAFLVLVRGGAILHFLAASGSVRAPEKTRVFHRRIDPVIAALSHLHAFCPSIRPASGGPANRQFRHPRHGIPARTAQASGNQFSSYGMVETP